MDSSMSGDIANTGIGGADKEIILERCLNIDHFEGRMEAISGGAYSKVAEHLSDKGLWNKEALYVLAGICALSIGKQINTTGFEHWFQNRLKGFVSIIRSVSFDDLRTYIPDARSMTMAYSDLFSLFELRRMLVAKILQYRLNKDLFGRVMKLIAQMIQYTDMAYVLNIDFYLLQTHPELLNIQVLAAYEGALANMMIFLDEHKDYKPFIRFFVPPEDCHPINRYTLRHLNCAATIVAERYVDSFKNYKGGDKDSQLYTEIKAGIDEYFGERSKSLPLALLHSRRNKITEAEKVAVMLSIQDKERRENPIDLQYRDEEEILT